MPKRTMPTVGGGVAPRKKRIRLTRIHSNRGANEGAVPRTQQPTMVPGPFPGDMNQARHGHHQPFPTGMVRRFGAWRGVTGLPGGKKR